MARTIVVARDGATSTFDFKKLDRRMLYGQRLRQVLDPDGNPCTRAELTDDGALLIRLGMTAQGYFDAETGAWIAQSELVGLDAAGAPVPPVSSTLGEAQDLEGPVHPSEVLDQVLKAVYLLDPTEVDDGLLAELKAGGIYRLPFAYRSDYHADVAFLLANDEGLFLLVGNPATPEWCALEQLPQDDFADDEDDDLDFDFL